jgi:ketosteroid isomerase-like protein
MKGLAALVIISLFSCNLSFKKEDKRVEALNSMQQTDADFSQLSVEKGFRKAFLEYMDEDGILLRDNHQPIIGADAIQYVTSINDSTFRLEWEPLGGDVAKSGDLGYTYGTYILSGDSTEQRGTYVTVWRKTDNGNWKFVMDAGTQGLDDAIKE